jgi:hypothetical protein
MLDLLILGAISALAAARLLRRPLLGEGISILVPFNPPSIANQRSANWAWLKRYWECKLPGAEIIMGVDRAAQDNPKLPFSKCVAVNDAAHKATGDIFVIADADCYISIDAVLTCAQRIRRARQRGHRLWFVPYRHFYRLTEEASQWVLESKPNEPFEFSCPPNPEYVSGISQGSGPGHGHWYGALIQIMPRSAFEEVGGWDERFRGWGGEDRSMMLATDELYWKHKTLPGCVFHVWHPMLSPRGVDPQWVEWNQRIWTGQEASNVNSKLGQRYHNAIGDAKKMRALLDESPADLS